MTFLSSGLTFSPALVSLIMRRMLSTSSVGERRASLSLGWDCRTTVAEDSVGEVWSGLWVLGMIVVWILCCLRRCLCSVVGFTGFVAVIRPCWLLFEKEHLILVICSDDNMIASIGVLFYTSNGHCYDVGFG